jgi:hypothetical protein
MYGRVSVKLWLLRPIWRFSEAMKRNAGALDLGEPADLLAARASGPVYERHGLMGPRVVEGREERRSHGQSH